jgi:hypothetical protein
MEISPRLSPQEGNLRKNVESQPSIESRDPLQIPVRRHALGPNYDLSVLVSNDMIIPRYHGCLKVDEHVIIVVIFEKTDDLRFFWSR